MRLRQKDSNENLRKFWKYDIIISTEGGYSINGIIVNTIFEKI